ncbi:MAG: molybdopterin molybdotransferase MoeA [Cytophagales bacterium]|nr:molybdopterin molybdotransferase MoeA [Cytophagales bacterium]
MLDAQISLSIDTALERLLRLAKPTHTDAKAGFENIPLHAALGRILAQDIISSIHVPPHDNSAMDGYAFHSSVLSGGKDGDGMTELAIVGKALAGKAWSGEAWSGEVGSKQCVQITTGAVMPKGCDTVVPSEFVTLHDTHIRFANKAVVAGDNRRKAGEDLMRGSVALASGSQITPAALGLIASLGMAQVPVRKRLRVAYFSTGDEVMSLGESLREGAIYDSNRFTVFGMLAQLGVDSVDLGVVPDNQDALEATFHKACDSADAIITSGGVSVGEADHTKTMMRQLGDVEFWRIAMRPGRPMAVGELNRADGSKAVLFGLPGNPVAVMVTFLALVRPALLQMMGAKAQALPLLQAKSSVAIRKKAGRTEYQRGIVSTNERGELVVQTTGNQGSGVLSSMVQANGLIVLSHEQNDVAVGDIVRVMMFDGAI